VPEIGAAIIRRRRPHRNEDYVTGLHGSGVVRGKHQPSRRRIPRDNRFQSRLENGDLPRLEALDFALVTVDADDMVAEVSQAGSAHQAHVARADYCN
jgi:hypothetical protein